jgi:Conserved TM helix
MPAGRTQANRKGATVLAINIQEGLTNAWNSIATFVPKLLGFLVIVIVGYIVAKLIARAVDALLDRVGFNRWVERGWLKSGLDRAHMDAADVLATVVFWTAFLLVLQLAFGVFGPNPISDLLHGLIAFLPNVFVAVVILVIASALAKVATDLLGATLGAVSGGQWIARGAGLAILIVGIFAALNQLQIAPEIVNGLYYAILAIIVGSAIVAVGGGGIRTMQQYWERASSSVEMKGREIKRNADPAAAKMRAQEMGDRVVTVPDSDPTATIPAPPAPPPGTVQT